MFRRRKTEQGGHPEGLNEHQRRVVTVGLRYLERVLGVVACAIQQPLAGVLIQQTHPLRTETVTELREKMAEAEGLIRELQQQYGLAPTTENVHATILAQLSSAWEQLIDTRPDALKGYGMVDPALSQTLQPAIDRLIGLVEQMQATVRADAVSIDDSAAPPTPPAESGH